MRRRMERGDYDERYGRSSDWYGENEEQGRVEGGRRGEMLVKLRDSDLNLKHSAEDIRGMKVVDSEGRDIGDVDDLYIDESRNKVRFMQVASGGFLGMGATRFLLPVEVVTSIDDDTVTIDRSRSHIANSPRYDPELVDQEYFNKVYNYYGLGYSSSLGVGPYAPVYRYPMQFGAKYRGRGPKGYQRSDERIREDINDELTENSFIDASNIEVSVENGEVRLTGSVNSRYEKRLAEDIAEDTLGVTNVQNELRLSSSMRSEEPRSRAAGAS
jgi:sporulation protein YlmC with PRC-barrel domain